MFITLQKKKKKKLIENHLKNEHLTTQQEVCEDAAKREENRVETRQQANRTDWSTTE